MNVVQQVKLTAKAGSSTGTSQPHSTAASNLHKDILLLYKQGALLAGRCSTWGAATAAVVKKAEQLLLLLLLQLLLSFLLLSWSLAAAAVQ
jgi:hypothetical protein